MRRNAGLLLAGRIVSAATTLVVLAIVARLRGPEALGAVGVGFALGTIAAALADGGTASLLVREAARRAEVSGELLGAGLVIRILTVPVTLLAVAAAAAIVSPDAVPSIVLVAAGLVAQQTAEVPRSVFIARQQMTVSASHSIVENLVWFTAIALALAAGWTLEATFGLALAVLTGSVLVGLVLVAVFTGVRPRLPTAESARRLARLAGPFVGFNVLGIAYSRIDTFLVGALVAGPALATAGAYFAATRIIAAFEYVPEAVSRAAYPELAKRSVGDRASVVPLLGRAAATLLVLGGAMPAILIVAGASIMRFVYGEDLPAAGWLLAVLALGIPFRFLGYLYGMALTSSDAQGRRVAAAAAALAIVVVVDVAFIPIVGLIAPVVAALAAAVLVLSLYGLFVRRRFGSLGLDRTIVAWVVSAGGASIAVGLFARPLVGEPVSAAIGAAVYALAMVLGPARDILRSLRAPVAPVRGP